MNTTKTGSERKWSGRPNSFFSTSVTRRVAHVKSQERGKKGGVVTTTNGTYLWLSAIFRNV